MDERLLAAIATPRIQQHASELVQTALAALDDLRQLDESLYERFVASRNAPIDPAANAANLRALWARTFRGLVDLLALCRTMEAPPEPEPAAGSDDFDFGELGDTPPPVSTSELELGSSDIGDLLEGIIDQHQVGDAERWARVIAKVSSIEYGLRSQYTEANERLEVALAAGETNQVLGILDDTQSSTSEGVHAVVTAVYEEFVPGVEAATLVPGYHTSLGRALMVRRGLAELQTTLDPFNARLQAGGRSEDFALRTIRDAMHQFVASITCRAMRAADRWQMVEFDRELEEQPVAAARMTSEGLVKYLDSLRSVSQREVLLVHDQRALEQIRESLSDARQLFDLSPKTASDMLDRAYHAAMRLRGRQAATDALLIGFEEDPPDPADPMKLLERLEAVLGTTG